MKLKAFLTDQTFIAGIGNIYTDEILFDSGLRYDRDTDSLTTQEIRRLYRSLVEILHEAVKYGGSTLADEQYVDLNGKPGEYQEHHQVYDREKQPCRRCRRHDIVKTKFRQRSTYSTARSDPARPGPRHVPQAPADEGLQVLRRHHHPRARARRHRRGGPQRVGQVQRGRRHRLGARRPGALRGALAEDGRRHLRRHLQAPGARPGRGRAHHRQRGGHAARSSSPRSRSPARCSAPATASTPSTACPAGCSTSRSCSPTPVSAASST